jgi:hypothetical protein
LTINRFIYKKKTILRHKLEKYPKLQKIVTSVYLKYCNTTGFLHTEPDFYIIGFAKCGTTSLFEYLISHPNVHPPKGKEIDFFDRLYSRGLNWYKVGFPFKIQKFIDTKLLKKKFLTGEATPRYIEHPHAINRIKEITPNAKFIILLRNPIDRAFSQHNMNVKNDYEINNFSDALKEEPRRIANRIEKMTNDVSYYSWNFDLYAYLEHGIYVDKIKRWMDVFPKEQFLIIQSEELLKNPSKIYNDVLEFLGLSKWEPKEFTLYKKRKYKEKMSSDLRHELVEYFKPHNKRLYDFLGKSFDWDK